MDGARVSTRIHLVVNGRPCDLEIAAACAAARRAARRSGSQGRQALVRHPGVRRVHGPGRRDGGERLHVSRAGGRRARRADGRGAGRRRDAPSTAAGVPRRRRGPVRLLHVRHAADGTGDAGRDGDAEPRRRRCTTCGEASAGARATGRSSRRSWPPRRQRGEHASVPRRRPADSARRRPREGDGPRAVRDRSGHPRNGSREGAALALRSRASAQGGRDARPRAPGRSRRALRRRPHVVRAVLRAGVSRPPRAGDRRHAVRRRAGRGGRRRRRGRGGRGAGADRGRLRAPAAGDDARRGAGAGRAAGPHRQAAGRSLRRSRLASPRAGHQRLPPVSLRAE